VDFGLLFTGTAMSQNQIAARSNMEIIEAQYQRWRQDPSQVEESWRLFFEGFELGLAQEPAGPAGTSQQTFIVQIINTYRRLGHFQAQLDPLSPPPGPIPQLDISNFGFGPGDLDRTFDTSFFLGLPHGTLRQLIDALKETYCRTIGVEYMHITDPEIRNWLQKQMEPRHNMPSFQRRDRVGILMELHYAELFEKFLHTKFQGQKRFSLEGAETAIPLLNGIADYCADSGALEIVIGMAHRGRLNVLANVLKKPYTDIFTEFDENYLPNSMMGDGDVKYHLGFSSESVSPKGNKIHLTLTPNPSHLEAVNPVVEGRVRAKQQEADTERHKCIPLLIHGDAAIAGQGLVAETLNLSQLHGYRTGGTIHIVINNQIGFTTRPGDARSTRYCTDVAKMLEVPIFHVNGEDPEACLYVAQLAVEFRQKFKKDVFIDMYCYRKWGHNEGDEPSFTSPVMYSKIQDHKSASQVYTDHLVSIGDMTREETGALIMEFKAKLENALTEVKQAPHYVGTTSFGGHWKSLSHKWSSAKVETGVSYDTLLKVAECLGRVPADFNIHPKMVSLLESRVRDVKECRPIAWGLGESLAFGSLLLEGVNVRMSGQDSRRGTFSHRHAYVYDYKTEKQYAPLQHLDPKQGSFSIFDSLLSEAAVLGFEFGYSLAAPHTLVMWEAQFGDFVNGAQVIIDQFIACSSSKWQRDSGLVMLLPHGYEGAGPEHSSARLERFLQLCGEENMQIVNPTTPAQMFHLLRRQMRRNFRRPLIVMTPKSLLRHKHAVSHIEAFTTGTFQEVIDEKVQDPSRVRRVLLCSGKVYYDLFERRHKDDAPVAIHRVEQMYPFPADAIVKAIKQYPKAREVVWVQEESHNMGAWSFMEPRLRDLGFQVTYIGRDGSASPATGSSNIHKREQKELVETALYGKASHLVRSKPHTLKLTGWEIEEKPPADVRVDVPMHVEKVAGS
jgi:2-oxoglutarate dehydrogenase E1 component